MNSASLTLQTIKVKNTSNKILAVKLSSIFLVLVLIALGGWKIKNDINGKILPKVTVAGIKIGGKTPLEAKKILSNYVDELNTKGPSINFEDQTIASKLPELGVTFDLDQTIANAYNYGRNGSFKDKIVQNSKVILFNKDVSLTPVIDEQKLDEFLSKVNQTMAKPAQNASLTIEDGQISVNPSKTGFDFDKNKLKENIQYAINHKIDEKITLEMIIAQPSIKEENTVEAQGQANAFLQTAPIILVYQDKNYVVDRAEIGSWIEFKEDGSSLTANISSDKVNTYIDKIASKIEIRKIDREIMEGTGEVLVEGQDGVGVDTDKLANTIVAQVKASNNAAIAIGTYPILKTEITKNPHAQPGRYPGRYIDVNLSEQTLYAFEGNNLVNHFLISSGKTGPTPTGTFSVYAKTRSQTMDGPGYSLPNVEWISWWSGDYSIHGTYWHNNFGHPMSHGCINASNADSEWVYNWDDIGTPVFIHW